MNQSLRSLILGALVCVPLCGRVAQAAGAPVNFKVQTLVDSREESLDHPRPYITAGSHKICFAQPAFCKVSSEPGSLSVFLGQPGVTGQFTVTNSPFKTDSDLLGNVETYLKAAEAALPADAKEVEFKGANNRVYIVNGWKSNTFEWSYKLYGKPIRRQVAFINIGPEHQICLTVLCDEESAPVALATAKRFMNSWFPADDIK